MQVGSLAFVIFVMITASAYNLFPALAWRQVAFLLANLWFLATFSHSLVAFVPLFAFLTIGYGAIRLLAAGHGRRSLWLVLMIVVAAFFWLKKYTFISFIGFMQHPYVAVGLSYIFFRLVHMVVDARDGNLPEQVGPLGYLNYMINFATLTSGPIQRYQDYAERHLTQVPAPLSLAAAVSALGRIVLGLVQSVLLSAFAMSLHTHAASALGAGQPPIRGVWTVLLLFSSYTLYLYFNFSGYTDIVIGVARFFRLELPENFNYPFLAANFLDLWNRWHMTLSHWFKFYVYNPLLGALMRRLQAAWIDPLLGVIAYFVTFFLIGLWHGQTSIFILYGVLLGLGASVNKLYQVAMATLMGRKRYRQLADGQLYIALCRGLTFTWFSLSLACFWIDGKMFGNISGQLGIGGVAAGVLGMIFAAAFGLAVIDAGCKAAKGVLAPRLSELGADLAVSGRAIDLQWVALGALGIFGFGLALIASSDNAGYGFVYVNF